MPRPNEQVLISTTNVARIVAALDRLARGFDEAARAAESALMIDRAWPGRS